MCLSAFMMCSCEVLFNDAFCDGCTVSKGSPPLHGHAMKRKKRGMNCAKAAAEIAGTQGTD
jgi:hypothetical protein